MVSVSIKEPINFDSIEYNFTSSSPFNCDSQSNENTINCLAISMKYYYDFIIEHQEEDIKLFDIKEHCYSIYLKSVLHKLRNFSIIYEEEERKESPNKKIQVDKKDGLQKLNSNSNEKVERKMNGNNGIVKGNSKEIRRNNNDQEINKNNLPIDSELLEILNLFSKNSSFFIQFSKIMNYLSIEVS